MSSLLVTANDVILLALVACTLAATGLLVAASRADARARRRASLVDLATAACSELAPPLSVLVTARADGPGLVQMTRSLLADPYPELELIVIDDSPGGEAIETLREAFAFVQVERVPRTRVPSGRVQRTYASPLDPRLLVLAKDPGAVGDALNAGLRFARYPLLLPLTAGVTLDRDALVRMTRPFQADPDTIACSARTRLRGRGPLFARSGLAVYRREAVVEVGGFDQSAAREDLDLLLRLRRHVREQAGRASIVSLAQPVASVPPTGDLLGRARAARAARKGRREALTRHRPGLAVARSLLQAVIVAAAFCAIAGPATGAVSPVFALADVALLAGSALARSLGARVLDGRPLGLRTGALPGVLLGGDPGATLIG